MNENRIRNEQVLLRFTEKEKEAFEKIFLKSGFKNKNQFVLYLLSSTTITNLNYDMKIFKDLNLHLSQLGNNLNQIVRRINKSNSIYKEDVEEIIQMKKEIEDIHSKINDIQNKLICVKKGK